MIQHLTSRIPLGDRKKKNVIELHDHCAQYFKLTHMKKIFSRYQSFVTILFQSTNNITMMTMLNTALKLLT